MYAIMGVTGQIGGVVARTLLAAKQPVRAVVRDAGKGQAWADRGCEVALATIEEAASRTRRSEGRKASSCSCRRISIRRRSFPRRGDG